MKKICLIFLLASILLLSSCTKASSSAKGASGLIDGSEKQSVFDMSERLTADGLGLGASAVSGGISFDYEGAAFYGGFIYIPYTVSGYDGVTFPDLQVSLDDRQEGPYYIDGEFDGNGMIKGAFYLPMREYKDSVSLKVSGFADGQEAPFGIWETGIAVKNVSANLLELEPEEEKTVNVFDAEYSIKKISLTDFCIRMECRLKSNNAMTEKEWMDRITSSESTGKSGYYDSYVQVLYKDGTVSPRYEYSLADHNVMWAWFMEEGQIDSENVRAVYIGGIEFPVE